MQVQLAHAYEEKRIFKMPLYSRKFDGKRMYYLDGAPYSRDNKECRANPIKHITDEIIGCKELGGFVTDGEVLYFESDPHYPAVYKENFKKAISLTSRIQRAPECDNLYYVIFDIIQNNCFLWQTADNAFIDNYTILKTILKAEEIPGRSDILKTCLPHVFIAKQNETLDELVANDINANQWEGLMLREGWAPYEYKRSFKLLKIKNWQDTELQVLSMKEGLGKHIGRLGALLCLYKDNIVSVGSGFNDQEREILWEELQEGGRLFDSLVNGELFIKVKYFEESCDANGLPSLRFPTYLCFRDKNLNEFVE